FDDLAVRKDFLHLDGEVLPLERAVEVVERRRAATQQELAQRFRVGVGQLQISRFDEINPRIREEPRIVQGEDDRILHVDRHRRFDASRQVLLRGWSIDQPRFAIEFVLNPGAFGRVVIFDANESPLQASVALVAGRRQLRVEARLQYWNQYEEQHQ